MNTAFLRVDNGRLQWRLEQLAVEGAIGGGGCCRLALSEEDKAGRDLVTSWMRELELEVAIDPVGNVFGRRAGLEDIAPVMTGSHLDTVRTGGRYDGTLGVLAGLEAVATLNDARITTRRPLVVAFFTNEEGTRFVPDMFGSLVYAGGLSLGAALSTVTVDGRTVGEELARIGYAGDAPLGMHRPHAFVELHIEQGPILDGESVTIGAVQNLQGISWQEVAIRGQSNHAGTTPMRYRHDAGYCAASIGAYLRQLARKLGGTQVCTMGQVDLHPNLINVIAATARVGVDLRNTDDSALQAAEAELAAYLEDLARAEGVSIQARSLVRLAPVTFDATIVGLVQKIASRLGLGCRRMTSGAGHDAQMLARICPAGMIFVPSVDGISHNVAEHTRAADISAGANVLLHTLLELAGSGVEPHSSSMCRDSG